MKLHVRVTADHIRRGERAECKSCPIALAIHDADPRFPNALVRSRSVIPSGERRGPDALWLPIEARRFIFHFDRGGTDTVSPFEFDINGWPDEVVAS